MRKEYPPRTTLSIDQKRLLITALQNERMNLIPSASAGKNEAARTAATTVKQCERLLERLTLASAEVHIDAPILWHRRHQA